MIPFIVDLVVKSTLLLLLALGVMLIFRRITPAMRHLVWSLALGGLLVLPVLTCLLPAWNVLPGWTITTRSDAQPERPQPVPPAKSGSVDLPVDHAGDVAAPLPTSDARPVSRFSWRGWLVALYIFGLVIALLPLAVSMMALRRLRQRATLLTSAEWNALGDQLRRELHVRQPVVLLQSADAMMPMTWGLLRPCILLPQEAEQWSPDRRRLVLLHELAHIKRRDTRSQLAARVVCALYWPHPLVWLAARQQRSAAELACDDCVLNLQTKPSTYASEILDMASTLHSPQRTSATAIAMARPSQLEHRLLAILDSSRSRRGLTRAAMCAVLVVGVTTLAVLAVCRADIKMASEPAASQPASQPAADAGSVRDVRPQDGAQRSPEKQAEAATARPIVINTLPAADATNVDPATAEIRVTFSKDMADGSWSWVTLKSNAFPKISGKIHYLEDKRTCVLPVQLEPNHHYKLGINSNRFRNFQDPDGRSAEPFVLEFDTGAGDGKAPATAPANSEMIKPAQAAAEQMLKQLDAGQYGAAWEQWADFAKTRVPQKTFVTALESARGPLGKVVERKLLSAQYMTQLPGVPDGQYVVLQYQTEFENKKNAVETITPMKEKDGSWRVSGYFIK